MISGLTRSVVLVGAVALAFAAFEEPRANGKEVEPKASEVLAMARAQTGERWYGIYVLGKKVGWQQDHWYEAEGRFCADTRFTLKMAFLGKVSVITSEERACYDGKKPFGLHSFQSVKDEDGRVINIDGRREEEQLVYRITTGNQERINREPDDIDQLAYSVSWAPIARMQVNDVVSTFSYDELTGKKRWEKYTLKEVTERIVRGRKQKIYKVFVEDEMGMQLDALISAEGIILEGTMGPSIRMVLEDKETATRTDLDLLDLYSTAFIEATGKLDYKRTSRVKKMVLTLTGESAINMAANGRQTVVEKTEKSVRLEVDACAKVTSLQGVPEARHRSCNADLPCDLADIIELAETISKGHKTKLARARALCQWVNKNFKYSLASGGGTGDQILTARKGDCTEYSKALITLLRSIKLPARQLSGVVLASDTPLVFGYHAWVEVWIKGTGWVVLDPTWGEFPVDATHVVFDVDEGLQMASHLGGLKIELIDVEYDEGKKGGITCD
jgi:hypothetical protein